MRRRNFPNNKQMTTHNDPSTYPPETGATGAPRPDHPEVHNRRDDADSATIQNDIDRTRGLMDRTLEELGERLRPGNLVDSAVGYLAGSNTPSASQGAARDDDRVRRAAGAVASTAWDKIKSNPMPSALIGAGVAWLFLKDNDQPSFSGSGGGSRSRGRYDRGDARRRLRRDEPEMYAGSLVDARTGEPYDRETYGREYRGQGGQYREGGGEYVGAYEDRDYDDRGHDSGGLRRRVRGAAASGARYAGGAAASGARYAGSAAASGAKSAGHLAAEAASSAASGVGSALSSAAHAVGDAAGYVGEKITGAASSTAETAGEAGRAGRQYASGAAGRAGDSARRGQAGAVHYSRQASDAARRYGRQGYGYSKERFEYARTEHPLAVGLGALAAGVLAGLVVPRTRVEDEQFGLYSRQAKDAAGDLAGEAYERGKHVVETGIDTAVSEARRQGLTPDQIRDQATQLLEKAKSATGDLQHELTRTASNLYDEAKRAASEVAGHAVDEAKRAGQQVKDQAADAASGLKSDVQDKAQDVKGDAQRSDLTPSGMKQGVSSIVEKTTQAVKDDAQRQAEEAKRQHGGDVKQASDAFKVGGSSGGSSSGSSDDKGGKKDKPVVEVEVEGSAEVRVEGGPNVDVDDETK